METKRHKFFRALLIIHSVYYLLTAIWGIADIESFMAVTGPKTDVWLVKTVSVLIIPIALALISFLYVKHEYVPAVVLGMTSAAGFAIIDFYYSLKDVISDVYMVDGAVQVLLFISWITVLSTVQREPA